jgi:hypothetical protein
MKATGNVGRPGYFGVALATALVALSTMANANENLSMTPQPTTPPARDPEIAVEEEYQIARRHGTAEALNLFIARHPDGRFADKARAELRRIKR